MFAHGNIIGNLPGTQNRDVRKQPETETLRTHHSAADHCQRPRLVHQKELLILWLEPDSVRYGGCLALVLGEDCAGPVHGAGAGDRDGSGGF